MRLPRMTIRCWMILVAAVGCLLGVAGMVRKSRRMIARAEFHARERLAMDRVTDGRRIFEGVATALLYRRPGEGSMGTVRFDERDALAEQLRASWQRRADYHAAMRRKYERAAMYPWLAVEPDPPEPEQPEL